MIYLDFNVKRSALLTFLLSSFLFFTQGLLAQNATNPYIYSDVPDVSIVRVGDTYYMSSTTMHMNPGVPIMKSKDLVNWDLVSYCYQTLDSKASYSLNNGLNEYGHGSWASSIRYHKGNYYVATFANTGKTYIYKTANIETGPWTLSVLNGSYHDCSLFFDDDDKAYLVYGGGDIKIIELTTDATAIKAGGLNKTLITDPASVAGSGGLRGEGSQVAKVNGYYYVSNICWPSGGMRTQVVSRSTSIGGTYQSKMILKDQGVAQGSFIDTPEGKWYCYLFRDYGAVGRVPYLVPMTWSTDGWPVLSAVPATLPIPKGRGGMGNLVSSDEFSVASPLKLAWQWNHNPVNNSWSMSTQKAGFLRLTNERTDPNPLMTTNTLTQRTFGPKSTAYTSIDVSGMKDGDYVGMIALQKQYGFIGVKMTGTNKSIVMATGDDVAGSLSEKATVPLSQNTIYVRVDCDFTNRTDKAYFFYSLNGTNWTSLGSTLSMSYTIPHFMGYRFGLFSYATKASGGYADFDYFRIGTDINNIFVPETSGPSVSFTLPVNNSTFTQGSSITLTATATTPSSTVKDIKFYDGTILLNTDNTTPYTFDWTTATASSHTVKAVVTDNAGKTAESIITIKVNVPQGPYNGTFALIPGKIEAEEYDLGGEGVAFHEGNANGNEGKATLRNDQVDLENCTDTGGGYNIGYSLTGEWLEYTVNVSVTDKYNFQFRVAKDGTAGLFHAEIDGVNVTGSVAVPNTGGWQTWQTVEVKNINLTSGTHIMKIVFDTDYTNFNYVDIKSVITGINDLTENAVQIFPNPFTEKGLSLSVPVFSHYTISNLKGGLLEEGDANGEVLVAKNLVIGVYILTISNEFGLNSIKISKQ